MREELRKDLANERARAEILPLYDKIEDERSIGRPLAEAAANLKLAVRTIEVNRQGVDPSGKPVSGIPEAQRLLNSAFTADVGVENDPLQVQGGYVWYEVAGITPERERTLDEVKEEIETRWRDDQVANLLRAKATEMLDKLKAGTAFAEVAEAAGLKVDTKTDVKRGNALPPLSVRTIDAIFRTAKDGFGTAEAVAPGEQVVFRVTDDHDAGSRCQVRGGREAPRGAQPQLHRGRVRRLSRLPAAPGRRDDQRERAQAGRHRAESQHHQLSVSARCRSSRRHRPLPSAMRAARRRWSGPRWSPISRRRCRRSSRSPAAGR